MPVTDVAVQESPVRSRTERIVNDFAIQVATVNGSGSQTANMVLLRSIFQMGVPVSGKNMFPSNIAGLPTWFTIRANRYGYIGRRKEVDFLVAMNPETAREDVMTLGPGAACVYDEALTAAESGVVHAMTDATEGGLATALHELAEAAGVGLRIEAESIPIRAETQKICAEFGIDPLGLIASGMLILTAPRQKVDELRRQLAERGLACTAIGSITPSEDGRLLSVEGELVELPYYASDELTRAL